MEHQSFQNIQGEYAQVEAQFYKNFYDLEKRYAAFHQPLFVKRAEIISVIHKPTEGEYQWEVGVQEGAWEEWKENQRIRGKQMVYLTGLMAF